MKALMQTVSAVFHPLLMATYFVIIYAYYSPELFVPFPTNYLYVVVIATFISTCLVPGLSMVFLKLTSRINNFELTDRQERFFPFFSIAIFYAAASYMFYNRLHIGAPIATMMVIMTSLIVLLLLITLKIKISIHAAAAWSGCGMLTSFILVFQDYRYVPVLAASFVFSGLVATSRLYLGRHTEKEILLGLVTGFGYSLVLSYVFF